MKYQCSYQQVRNWVKRYEEMGSKGLEDRRGKRAGTLPSRTPEEELRDKIAELERKNLDLQMENGLPMYLNLNITEGMKFTRYI